MYTVSFQNLAGHWEVSRYFNTLRAARKWAKWIAGRSFAAAVSIHRGQAGGELIERT